MPLKPLSFNLIRGNVFLTGTLQAFILVLALISVSCDGQKDKDSLSVSEGEHIGITLENENLNEGRVESVIDGVTLVVESGGQLYRVRYLGIEIAFKDSQSIAAQELSKEAFHFNRFLVSGKPVEMEKDEIGDDGSGNLLRYVYVEGEMVNRVLIEKGYAEVSGYPENFRWKNDFISVMETARNQELGVWGDRPTLSWIGEDDGDKPTDVPFHGGTLPPRAGLTIDNAGNCDFSESVLPVIKGNVDRLTGDKRYHPPDTLFYDTIRIDYDLGDRWFCTENEARSQGWNKSKR